MKKKRIYLLLCIIITLFFITIFYCKMIATQRKLENKFSHLIKAVNYESDWDSSEDYRITSPLLKRKFFANFSDVTLVTQCSPNKLINLVNLCERWQGPISLAVFSYGGEVIPTLRYIALLNQCNGCVATFVTFHLVTYRGTGNLKDISVKIMDCSTFNISNESLSTVRNYDMAVAYPVNLLRNVARKGMSTRYLFLIDIDLTPNLHLRSEFIEMIKEVDIETNTVYAVPVFEINEGVPLPDTKKHLAKLFLTGQVRQFYVELCQKCHSCLDYDLWFSLPEQKDLNVAYSLQWHDPCEPFYIATSEVPLYDESFKQYGFNRVSQICELYVAGYQFKVLDNSFLIHAGLKTMNDFHSKKDAEHELNRLVFRNFKQNLKIKYPKSRRRC